jgi:cyclase
MHRKAVRFQMAVLALALAAPALAQGQGAQQPQPLDVRMLKPNVYYLVGGGGNTGVVIGTNGVIIVDTKTTPAAGQQIVDEVKKLTPKPITTVFLTHSDGDHVNGLASFPSGIKIIAHENEKKEEEAALQAGGRGAPPADKLPTQVVTKNKEDMTVDGVKVEVLHWAPAHTSGDLVVYFPDQKVVFTGDIIATQRPDPLIHPEKNGSSEGWITTGKGIAALDADQFVPGHGDVQTKAQIQQRVKDTEEKRSKIAAMVKQGKSLEEIKAAVDTAPAAPPAGAPPAGGGQGGGRQGAPGAGGPGGGGGRGPGIPSFTDVVYQELTKKG